MLAIYPGGGAGYGVATPELMAFCAETARQSGVLLDHTYSGKALYYFAQAARAQPDRFRGKHILFWHTGGALALFAKTDELLSHLPPGQVRRLKLP
mmetsp:Transcript_13688/g.45659  ORF Transcript_13688/g.45659 Transcript_13688/m.45659 type:complete len:96 (+) Transcript_13688:151-438(+)